MVSATAYFGLTIDLDRQVALALRTGRGNGLIQDIGQTIAVWQQGLVLPLQITIDARTMQDYLIAIGAPLERLARDAAILVDPATGTGTTIESAEGFMLLINDTVAEAIEAIETLEPQRVPICTQRLNRAHHIVCKGRS